MGFSFDIDPTAFSIGGFDFSYYWLVYLAGFVVCIIFLLRATKKNKIEMSEKEVYGFAVYFVIGLILGARAFYVIFWGGNFYWNNPIWIFLFWKGGMSFHGGLLGAFLTSFSYTNKKKINFLKVADILTLPALFFLALGRIANFFNQEIVGTVTNVPWCFNFRYDEGCKHPVQLYAAAGRFMLFGFLLWMKKSLKSFREGFIFWSFVFLICVGRFILDFWREDIRYFGLASGQLISLVFILIGLYVLKKHYWSDVKRVV